jgi:hypothetical protein
MSDCGSDRGSGSLDHEAKVADRMREEESKMMKKKLAVAAAGAALVISPAAAFAAVSSPSAAAPAPTRSSSRDGLDWQIRLNASSKFSQARGTAEYQKQSGQREFQTEVGSLGKLTGHRVAVYVGGKKVGTVRVNSRGVAHLDRNTEHGQSVPHVVRGMKVKVRTAGGALIARGAF